METSGTPKPSRSRSPLSSQEPSPAAPLQGPAPEQRPQDNARAGLRAIIVVDHGSRLAEANAQLVEVAALIAREDPAFHVEPAHMELAEPTLEQAFEACVAAGAKDVTILPYMLSPGRHAKQDIPRLAAAAARAHPDVALRVAEPLGVHPGLARAVLDRVREARGDSTTLSAPAVATRAPAGTAPTPPAVTQAPPDASPAPEAR